MKYKYIVIFLLLFIFTVGFLLRSIEVASGNFVFGFDQGLYHQDVNSFITAKKPILIGTYTPLPGIFQHPLFYWLLGVSLLISHGNPYGSMVLMHLISILAIFAVLILSKKMYGLSTSLLVTFLFALSYPVSHGARILWPPLPIFLVMPFYLFFVYQVLKGKHNYFPFIFLSLGFILAFEIAAGSLLIIPTFIILFLLARKSITLKNIILSLILNVILFSPLILFNLRHENIMLHGFFAFLKGESSPGEIMNLSTRFVSHAQSIIENFKFSFASSDIWKVLFPLSIFMIISYFIYYKNKDKFVLFLVLLPVLTFFELLIFRTYVWPWYLIPFTVSSIFLIGIASSKLLSTKNYLLIFIVLIFFLIFSVDSIKRVNQGYKSELYDYGGTAKIRGKTDAIDFIYQDAKKESFNLLVFSPPVYVYPYDYLLNWYGKNKYDYIPGKNKAGNLYLLIEPDFYNESSYEGWLKTVIKDGEIIKTERLPSGFIVQKRLIKSTE